MNLPCSDFITPTVFLKKKEASLIDHQSVFSVGEVSATVVRNRKYVSELLLERKESWCLLLLLGYDLGVDGLG